MARYLEYNVLKTLCLPISVLPLEALHHTLSGDTYIGKNKFFYEKLPFFCACESGVFGETVGMISADHNVQDSKHVLLYFGNSI